MKTFALRMRRGRCHAGCRLVVVAMLAGGCTILESSRLPPEELRSLIRDGSLVETGDQVSVVTRDGREHTFTVSRVEADAIAGGTEGGAEVTISIDDVVALRKRRIDAVRTAAAAVGGYLVVVAAVAVYAISAMFDDLLD